MSDLKVALVLGIEDQLTAGLKRIEEQFEQLRQIGRGLRLDGLNKGLDQLRSLGRLATGAAGDIRGIGTAADKAWGSVKRMGTQLREGAHKTFGPQGKLGAMGGAIEGYMVFSPIESEAQWDAMLRGIARTEGFSGKGALAEMKKLQAFFRQDAIETGQSSASIAEAYKDLIGAGLKVAVAKALLPIHSLAATAYQINPVDLGHAVYVLSSSFGIAEKDMKGARGDGDRWQERPVQGARF